MVESMSIIENEKSEKRLDIHLAIIVVFFSIGFVLSHCNFLLNDEIWEKSLEMVTLFLISLISFTAIFFILSYEALLNKIELLVKENSIVSNAEIPKIRRKVNDYKQKFLTIIEITFSLLILSLLLSPLFPLIMKNEGLQYSHEIAVIMTILFFTFYGTIIYLIFKIFYLIRFFLD
jgi:hypothetical protein